MADVKISALPAASALSGSDVVPVVQSGATKKATATQIKAFANSGLGANPTATAGNTVVNGAATTFMRSDAAPAVQLGSDTQFGLLKVDGSTITAAGGVITATGGGGGGPSPANPSATAGPTANNGVATTYMRSDASPAVQQGSASIKGIVQVDGTTITATSGVISAVGGGGASPANPTATASNTAVNGSAGTFMRSDAAPAIQLGSSTLFGLVKVDNSTITASGGVISAVGGGGGPSAGNPTATAGATAINGSAGTFMRSDGAPAVAQGSAATKGIVQVDGTSILASSGVISVPTATGAALGISRPDGTNLTITTGVVNVSASLQTWAGITPGTGVATFLATPSSANLAAAVTGETGTGALVFATSPTLVTPVLGTPASGNLGSCTADGTNAVGYRNMPVNAKTGAYTLLASDLAKYIPNTTGGWTINNSVFSAGDVVTVYNDSASNQTITQGAGVTMYLAGTATTGNRTLAQRGWATAIFKSASECTIGGPGLT